MKTRVRRNTRLMRYWSIAVRERPGALKEPCGDPHQKPVCHSFKSKVSILGQTLWVCHAKLREPSTWPWHVTKSGRVSWLWGPGYHLDKRWCSLHDACASLANPVLTYRDFLFQDRYIKKVLKKLFCQTHFFTMGRNKY